MNDSPRLTLVVASCLLCVPLLLGSAQQALPDGGSAGDIPAISAGAGQTFRAAAAAMRRHDCAAALAELAPLAAGGGSAGDSRAAGGAGAASGPAGAGGSDKTLAGLVSGLYAQACGQVPLAEERLFSARSPNGMLEDWRLLLLGDSAHARGHVLVAKAALAKLLGDYPASPLRPRALVRAAALDWERADADGAIALVRRARREGLRGEDRTSLDALAWDIGTRRGDAAIRTEAARELLVSSPLVAAQLGVAEVFRRADGTLSLASALSAAQLKQRAQALLALQLEPSALATLDEMPPGDRDLQWVLLKAEVLTRAHRGGDALALLRPLQTTAGDRDQGTPERARREMQPLFKARSMAALEWALAQAADDLAAAQHGRSARVQAERRKLRLAARLHLRSVAEIDADPELSIRALRALYAHLIEEDLFAPAVEALHRLRALDPKDLTGANLLWARGWQDFSRRDYRGAIGYWTQLDSLYPADSSGRRARYWTARCREELGERERAQQLYSEVAAADTSDFYRRNALARLARFKAAAPAAEARSAEPWPYDAVLVRAQLLTDLGLDALAQSELDLVRDRSTPRSVSALQAVILARRGDRRQSVLAIREAFPALGGPFQAAVPEEALKLYYPLDYEQPIRASAVANGLAPALVFGVIRQESAFDANALSRAGASGLMQLMPGTARELARGLGLTWSRERLIDPAWNVQIGASYLRQVLAMFDGNVELALAAYNGGPYRIKRLWREARTSDLDRFVEGLSIEESKVYVKRILVLSDSYRRLYPHAAG
ncbi:MAG TPA: lytic transglycosylase domain-containing protein [Thermoanaerobaculia bacterium]|nr:lytic transglycosylase domain-containing protein [Thermoanaerobaculia bacterium]